MEGHEVFGPLQLRRIDWGQEMFKEEEEQEQERVEPGTSTGTASSSGQYMEVDDEGKNAVAGAVTVDATKVAEEKEGRRRKRSHRVQTWEEMKLCELSVVGKIGGEWKRVEPLG